MDRNIKESLHNYQLAKANLVLEKQKLITETLKVLIIKTKTMNHAESTRYFEHFIECNIQLFEIKDEVQKYFEEYLTNKTN